MEDGDYIASRLANGGDFRAKNIESFDNLEKNAIMNWQNYISEDPKIMYGKPVIKGTRVPVDIIIEKLSKGESIDYLLTAYPHINKEQILACLAYATDLIRNEDSILTQV